MSLIGNAIFGINGYGDLLEHPNRAEPGHVLWFFQIDLDGDGVFDHRVLPPTLRALEFERGTRRRDDPRGFGPSQPESERFQVEILDRDAVFWNSADARAMAAMTSGRMARLLCLSTTTKAPMEPVFTGVLRSASYDPNAGTITFKGTGLADSLTLGTAEEVRDHAIPYNSPDLGAFIPDSGAPAPINHWRGQMPGTGLAACVRSILDASLSNLALAAEVIDEIQPEYFTMTGGSAWNALRAVCAAFMARVEFTRDGKLSLRRLGEDPSENESAMLLENLNVAPSRSILPAPGLVNRVNCRLRPLHAPLYTLPIPPSEYGTAWSAAGPIMVPPGGTVILSARFRKTEGSVFAANILRVNTDLPMEEEPLVVNSLPDKSGVNMASAQGTGEGTFSLTPETVDDPAAPYQLYRNYGNWQDQARLTLRNTSTEHEAYFFNLRLYAAGLSQRVEPSWLEVRDVESGMLFGERSLKAISPLIQDAAFASQCAGRALRYFKTPDRAAVTKVSKITHGEEVIDLIQGLELGTLVDLPIQAGLPSSRHRVLGASARWLNGTGEFIRGEWTLEKALAPQATITSVSSTLIQFQENASFTHAGGIRAGEYFLLCASTRSWGWISSVSVDGRPLERLAAISLGFATNGDLPRAEIWGAALPNGAGAVSIRLDRPDWGEFASLSVKNVDLNDPIRSTLTEKAFDGDPNVTMELSESDLMICVAGFKQYDPPVPALGTSIYELTCDNNWRGGAASASGLRSGSVGWSEVTGGYALAGVVLNALWHHAEN